MRHDYCLSAQDLAKDFNDAHPPLDESPSLSADHGRILDLGPARAPMFDDHTFTTIWFADFGRGNADAPDRFA